MFTLTIVFPITKIENRVNCLTLVSFYPSLLDKKELSRLRRPPTIFLCSAQLLHFLFENMNREIGLLASYLGLSLLD